MATVENWWKDRESKKIGVVRVGRELIATAGMEKVNEVFGDTEILGIRGDEEGMAFVIQCDEFEDAPDNALLPEYMAIVKGNENRDILSVRWEKRGTDEEAAVRMEAIEAAYELEVRNDIQSRR